MYIFVPKNASNSLKSLHKLGKNAFFPTIEKQIFSKNSLGIILKKIYFFGGGGARWAYFVIT